MIREVTRRVAKNTFLSAEDAEGRGEHQRRIGFSLRSCAALRQSGIICTRKSLFRQTSTSPSSQFLVFSGTPVVRGTPEISGRWSVVRGGKWGRRHCWPDTLLEPHGWNEHTRTVSDGFVGGRCGGAAPAQGRAEGPTAQNTTMWGERTPLLLLFRVANQLRLRSYDPLNEVHQHLRLSS